MEEVFIGRVVHSDIGWSRLEPLASVVEGRWRLIEDVATAFPPSGRIFALPRALQAPRHGSLWLFTRQLNSRPEPGKDKYVVDVASPPVLVVDLSHGSVEQARQTLFDTGIRQQRQGSKEAVVLLIQGSFCVLELEPASRGVWKAVPSSHPVNLMAAANEWRESDVVDGQKYFPSMHIPSTPVVRRVNWCSDAEFVSKILQRTRRYAQQLGDTKYAGPAREGVQYVARALEQVQLFPGSPDDIELDLERLQAQWPALQAKLAAAEEMHSMLLESSTAKEQLAKALADARVEETARLRAELAVEVRAELLAELAEKVRERDGLVQELATLTSRLGVAGEANQRLQEEATSTRAGLQQLRAEVQNFVSGLRDSFERLPVSEVAVARALAEQLTRSIAEGQYVLRGLVPTMAAPWSLPYIRDRQGAVEVNNKELKVRFDSASKEHAIERDALLTMHAFARSGELVLLTGVNADRALAAYTKCVSGGSSYSMAVDPSTIGLDDLWRAPGSLAPTALAYAWNRAMSDAATPVVLCISNLDASPFHLWVRSFADELKSRARPRNLLVFARTMAVPGSDAADPYPFQEDLKRWLVPIEPGQANGSSLQVLGSLASSTAPTVLSWSSTEVEAVIKTESFAGRISEVAADAETVLRAAHVAAAWLEGTSDAPMWSWVECLASRSIEGLPVFLRNGYASLAKLAHQH